MHAQTEQAEPRSNERTTTTTTKNSAIINFRVCSRAVWAACVCIIHTQSYHILYSYIEYYTQRNNELCELELLGRVGRRVVFVVRRNVCVWVLMWFRDTGDSNNYGYGVYHFGLLQFAKNLHKFHKYKNCVLIKCIWFFIWPYNFGPPVYQCTYIVYTNDVLLLLLLCRIVSVVRGCLRVLAHARASNRIASHARIWCVRLWRMAYTPSYVHIVDICLYDMCICTYFEC